jgi:dolichol-phosphate mannosyltransferase
VLAAGLTMSLVSSLLLLLLIAQLGALVVLCARLARGRHRLPPVEPRPDGVHDTSVSVVVPARNEAHRIGACLDGLRRQGAPLVEVIVVDGGSTDATPALVDGAALADARIRRIAEPPRPPGSVGRPWAIAAGCAEARGDWIMVVDADTAPRPGMIAGAVAAARSLGLDVVSFAPRIVAPSAGARWLQPAFLTTLVYRFGPAGVGGAEPERVLANGQCLLLRRAALERAGGYGVAADSYCDDVRIARHLAAAGSRVGFLDGPRLLDVEMYPTARETWRAWPRSLNLRDATGVRWRWLDAVFLLLAQGLPLPMLLALALAPIPAPRWLIGALAAVNAALLGVRLLLSLATAHSFAQRGAAYWLAPLADPAAVLRVVETIVRRPREWRGRVVSR